MIFKQLWFALLLSSSLIFSMDDPSPHRTLSNMKASVDKINVLKAQIDSFERVNKEKEEEFQCRLRALEQQKSAVTKKIVYQVQTQVEELALHGAALIVQKALDCGYHSLFVQEESSDLKEFSDAAFSMTQLIAFNEVVLKSLKHLANHKGRIFSHSVNYHGINHESRAVLDHVRKDAENNQKQRYLTMRLLNECFMSNSLYNDSLLERAALGIIGAIFLAPAMAVDVSNAVVASLNLKKEIKK